MNARARKPGQVLIETMVFGTIAVIIIGGLANWAIFGIRAGRSAERGELAFQIAEAGIEYYRWHLAHAPTDYEDGTGGPGPYVHDYYDKNGDKIGEFALSIAPPQVGSTLVTISSTGTVEADPNLSAAVEVRLAIPSLAKFAVVSHSDLRFGAGTEVFGPIHSNGGIRFDGLAHNVVSSSRYDYDDPDHGGQEEFGVHTHIAPVDPLPPPPMPVRTDVFEAGREIEVPGFDFAGLTSDLAAIKANAQASGLYFASSGASGYRIQLKTDDTFDIYRVNSLFPAPNGCTNLSNQSGWGTWSIGTTGGATTLLGTYAIPANGLVFVEDHVWVDGQIDSARVTIASGRFPDNPSTRTNIIVNNDVRYTNYDGQDVIGLIAQGHIHVGMVSETDLRIDAALVAQNGRVGRFSYRPPNIFGTPHCSPYHVRDVITLYGMIASYARYGFAYTDGNGYQIRNLNYDSNLLYSPPPSFPLTSDQYVTLSWRRTK